jgi:protoheme IX farnesyltransferase
MQTAAPDPAGTTVNRTHLAEPRDYFQLLKPRVMSLVVFTALTGLVAAPVDMHPVLAAVAVLCIAIGAGAAGSLNMALEAETDALMRRTRGRPVAAGRVSRNAGLSFGVILSLFSVMLMGVATNWVAAGLLALTIVYYAWFYTLVLKRRTPQNIVIGGAAGALPPVIGWAAATGDTPLNAWLMFLIIFLWTPPHSWALALYTAGDYAKAGIPMMPVAKGPAHTRLLILLYSLVLVPVAGVPVLTGLGGLTYGLVAGFGGLGFLLLAWRLYRSRAGDLPDASGDGREAALYDVKAEAKSARNLFAFSILYLFALFAALLFEHGLSRVIP